LVDHIEGLSRLRIRRKKGCRLRMFANRVLRRKFGSRREKLTGEWRKLHNEQFMICTAHQVLFG
jgi:hypothetical protein